MTDTRPAPVQVGQRAARLVTEATSPAVFSTVLPLLIGAQADGRHGLLTGVVAAVFTGAIPYSFLLWAMRRGMVADRHIRQRAQRATPLLFGLASVILGLVLLVLLDAPPELLGLVGAMIAGLGVTLAITTVWKISVHTGVAAGSGVILAMTFGSVVLLPTVLIVAAIAWARVSLTDHTTAQVVAGAVVGAAVAGLAFGLLT